MTTSAADVPIIESVGSIGSIPCIVTDIVWEGSAVGTSAGYGRPLVAGDRFRGFCMDKCDNSAGAAGAKNIKLLVEGRIQVPIAAVYITDVGLPVYASDDATFTMVGANASGPNSYIGRLERYVDATHGVVKLDVGGFDQFGDNPNRILKSANYTSLITDNGKIIYVDTTGVVVTLCIGTTILGAGELTVVNAGGDGLVLVEVDPDNADLLAGGCGVAANADGHKIGNTAAGARRGDFIKLAMNGTTGWNINNIRGTWASE
jgi:hypothetical protein